MSADEFARIVDDRLEEIAVAALDSAMYWHMRDHAISGVPGFADDAVVKMAGNPLDGWVAAAGSVLFYVVRRYPSPITGATPDFDVRALDIDVPEVTIDDKVEPDVPRGYLESFRSTLQEIFERWRSLPAPEGISAGVVTPIMDAMYLVSDEPSALSAADRPPVLANKEYHALLARFGDATPHLHGVAMDYFKEKYVQQLGVVVPNLQYVMGEIAIAALGNALAIQRTRAAVLTILDEALVAMDRAKPGNDHGGLAVAVGILGAVVAAAATLATGGTAAPFALTLGGGVISVLAGTINDDGAQAPEVELGASDPDGVIANIRSALGTTDRELLMEEQAAAYSAFDQIELLAAPRGPGESDPFGLDEPSASRGPLVIEIERHHMATLWDTLPLIAGRLRRAAALLDDAVGKQGAFQHGSVGRSTLGAQPDIASAGGEAWRALRALANDLDEGAQGLKDVWRDFNDTDGLTREEFATIKTGLTFWG
ncbi:hypothetical protein GGQ22_10105 [Nocardioides sp. zg-579]|uniref:Uncharacterized protein n=1 Tax=Nocardioides marmotae TaxID=2663857 RepID=A0A6I3JBD8_9ACTN|nr:hypothetical protein [Nocardioides marmotae]MCR6031796.1 hypothetical protein [Gordonia jinghuaiqii]MTB95437.1 hypothetical protein [Nocardioides marmotae]QKE00877.1 hypothetical protein HPC71_07165 [Nocardioides marmotae]